MQRQWNLLDTNTNIFIELDSGKTVQVTGTMEWTEDDDYDNSLDDEEDMAEMKQGKVFPAVVRVTCTFLGISEAVYLGGCVVRTREHERALKEIIEECGLLAEAASALETALNELRPHLV